MQRGRHIQESQDLAFGEGATFRNRKILHLARAPHSGIARSIDRVPNSIDRVLDSGIEVLICIERVADGIVPAWAFGGRSDLFSEGFVKLSGAEQNVFDSVPNAFGVQRLRDAVMLVAGHGFTIQTKNPGDFHLIAEFRPFNWETV